MDFNDDLEKLIENLPFFLQEQLNLHTDKEQPGHHPLQLP